MIAVIKELETDLGFYAVRPTLMNIGCTPSAMAPRMLPQSGRTGWIRRLPSRVASLPNKKVKILWPFRQRRPATRLPPPDAESQQVAFDRAWADYVEWSGLDESGLPDARREDDR
ncbi:hypothetical protein [Dietzia sp. PP-33]|uniref:hypothetical protein n=1 Tax=Dietzia sp. PP-33 TaxID=2957500 RepID=UPI0029B41773|nr:hypothetical protein [Dietzia sp. PP-33]MDX2358751.1 hypothetical protein [Dietzia sp. PP-33]